jgi:prepilin-type N-terminal cleavage/methylation domain-containing protein
MKSTVRQTWQGFTLIELLVVIAIIGILAAMLLPALIRVKIAAQISRAKIQEGQIIAAIGSYESAYSRFPVASPYILSYASSSSDDFTFGATLNTPSGQQNFSSIAGTNNAEIIAILMDEENYGDGTHTVNYQHVKNPKRNAFLDARKVSDTTSAGVGLDGVYRDPWGQPYVITMDLNNDGKARDAFYRKSSVSKLPGGPAPTGLNGLYNSADATGASDMFECSTPVMVWSAGPDKMVDQTPNAKANTGVNKDNVLSWH